MRSVPRTRLASYCDFDSLEFRIVGTVLQEARKFFAHGRFDFFHDLAPGWAKA